MSNRVNKTKEYIKIQELYDDIRTYGDNIGFALEPGQIYEPPSVKKLLNDYLTGIKNQITQQIVETPKVNYMLGMLTNLLENVKSITKTCLKQGLQNIPKSIGYIKNGVIYIKEIIETEVEEYATSYQSACEQKMYESSQLFRDITNLNNTLSSIDQDIETLLNIINDAIIDDTEPLNMKQILSVDDDDVSSIFYFAFNGQFHDEVIATIHQMYHKYKSLYGTSNQERTHIFPNTVSQYTIIKNIISIFYTKKEDFTDVTNYSDVNFKDVYSSTVDSLSEDDPIYKAYYALLQYSNQEKQQELDRNKGKVPGQSMMFEGPDDEDDPEYEPSDDFDTTISKSTMKPKSSYKSSSLRPIRKFKTYSLSTPPAINTQTYTPEQIQNIKDTNPELYDRLTHPNKYPAGGKLKKTKKTKKSKKTKKIRKNKKNKKSKKRQHKL